MLPGYISDLFVVRNNVKFLRGTDKLVVPRKKTTVEFLTGWITFNDNSQGV